MLARDPLGIKPLFYHQRGDGIVFASELKALLAALGAELRIEPGALVASMLYYWVPEQRCAIDGVHKLPGRLLGRVSARAASIEVRHVLARPGRGRRGRGRPGRRSDEP